MRERKYVKFRVDMYNDTKFKIIDMKPERDVIHYVWNRIVLLAGKVNLEGDLYFSKNIPYTIETLAIEFNRDITQVKLALDLLIELEMIELSEYKVYRVKNFAKHQGIKVEEKEISKNRKIQNVEITNKDIIIADESKEALKTEIPIMRKTKKPTRINKKKKGEILNVVDTDGEINDNSECSLQDEVTPLVDEQLSISAWSFG